MIITYEKTYRFTPKYSCMLIVIFCKFIFSPCYYVCNSLLKSKLQGSSVIVLDEPPFLLGTAAALLTLGFPLPAPCSIYQQISHAIARSASKMDKFYKIS